MSIQVLPPDILSFILNTLPLPNLVCSRRVCKVWKGIVESRQELETDIIVAGNILACFPKLRKYAGPVESLQYMQVTPETRLFHIKPQCDGLGDLYLLFAVIRDYYRAGLATKLVVEPFFINMRGENDKTKIKFHNGLLKYDSAAIMLIGSYISMIGKAAEMDYLGFYIPRTPIRRLICRNHKHMSIVDGSMIKRLKQYKTSDITLYLSSANYSKLLFLYPEIGESKTKIILDES